MFDWVKKLFGEGKIRCRLHLTDGTTAVAVVPYIGDISTLDKQEFTENMDRQMFVQHGRRVSHVEILGWY